MVIAESYNIIKGQIRKRLHNVKQNDFKMKVQFVKSCISARKFADNKVRLRKKCFVSNN